MVVDVLVMASGFSRRMGQNKLLLSLCGETVIYQTVRSAVKSGFHRVLTIYADEKVGEEAARAGAETKRNLLAFEGQSASIRLGVRALSDDADGILFLPGDQPFLSEKTLRGMCGVFCQNPGHIIAASFCGKRNSPVLFPDSLFSELMKLQGDSGGREILVRHSAELALYDVADKKELMDIDTRQDYAKTQMYP